MSNNIPQDGEDDDSTFITAAYEFDGDIDMDEDFSIQGDVVQIDLQALQDDLRVNEAAINNDQIAIGNDQDDSSGTVMSAYQMEMPHTDGQPAPPNPIQQALNEFLQNNPLCVPITVALLSYFQNIRDVPRDGSCFYHCCMLWLYYTGQAFNGTVSQFRHDVYRHLSRVLATLANERPFRDAIGDLLPDFRISRRWDDYFNGS
eukprot:scaffold49665_cov109-Cyclotella_meneghiniana.AAC.2